MNYLSIAFSTAEDRLSKLDIKFKECTLNKSQKDKMRKIKIRLRGTENMALNQCGSEVKVSAYNAEDLGSIQRIEQRIYREYNKNV